MDERLLDGVLERLDASPLDVGAEELLLAALEGDAILAQGVSPWVVSADQVRTPFPTAA